MSGQNGNGKFYSETELAQIAAQIQRHAEKRKAQTVNLGKDIKNDWSDEGYIATLYDDIYLKAVQQEYVGQQVTFEQFLQKCLTTLNWRINEELPAELAREDIDLPIYNNAKMVGEMARAAITKYLERSDTQRLIGV